MNNVPVMPQLFREALSQMGAAVIDSWWAHLGESDRAEALDLWSLCQQQSIPVELRFEAEAEDAAEDGPWHSDYYEWIVNHELHFLEIRGIHICTRHPQAAAAGRNGIIPRDFDCPFASVDCPMKQLIQLSGGKDVKLRVKLAARV